MGAGGGGDGGGGDGGEEVSGEVLDVGLCLCRVGGRSVSGFGLLSRRLRSRFERGKGGLTVCVRPAFSRLYPARAAATREKKGAVV